MSSCSSHLNSVERKPRYVYRADLDQPGSADVLFDENATLSKQDRSLIMWSLEQKPHIANAQLLKKTDVFIHDGNGHFKLADSCCSLNNQVCDLSYGFNFNLETR